MKHLEAAQHFLTPDFPLRAFHQRQTEDSGHTHGFSEIVCVMAGKGVHVTEDEAYPIMAGDVFVITGDRAHGYRDTERLDIINILFIADKLPLPVGLLNKLPGYHALFCLEPLYRRSHRFKSRLRLELEELAAVADLLRLLDGELSTQSPGYEFMACTHFMHLIGFLSRCYAGAFKPEARPLLRLGGVLSFLEEHYAEQLRVEELAKMAHMSPSTFTRAFRRATGFSPAAFLARMRVRKAAELLSRKACNCTEAALRVGFTDSNYFSRSFRRLTGVSPREYLQSSTDRNPLAE